MLQFVGKGPYKVGERMLIEKENEYYRDKLFNMFWCVKSRSIFLTTKKLGKDLFTSNL